MDKQEQIKFVQEAMAGVLADVIKKIENGDIPPYWYGPCLRQYLADQINYHPLRGKDRKEYDRDLAANLKL